MSEWVGHADWWLSEIADDPIYQLDVVPLAMELLGTPQGTLLDLGCGEGQLMRALQSRVVGCDISQQLLELAAQAGPVVRARLPELSWLRPGSVAAAYAVLVLEHMEDLKLFAAAARVVQTGGALVVVSNHPAFTAEASGPILDPSDGEVLWRWGDYFVAATVSMPTEAAPVTFYHRPLGAILEAAAAAGWVLDRFVEAGFSAAAVASEPGYAGQEQMPRLLGARWINTQGGRPFRR